MRAQEYQQTRPRQARFTRHQLSQAQSNRTRCAARDAHSCYRQAHDPGHTVAVAHTQGALVEYQALAALWGFSPTPIPTQSTADLSRHSSGQLLDQHSLPAQLLSPNTGKPQNLKTVTPWARGCMRSCCGTTSGGSKVHGDHDKDSLCAAASAPNAARKNVVWARKPFTKPSPPYAHASTARSASVRTCCG